MTILDRILETKRVELEEQETATLEDRDFGSGACSEMGKFRRNITTADEHDLIRKCIQFKKGVAVGQQFLTFDPKRSRGRSGCDQCVGEPQVVTLHFDPIGASEARPAVERCNALAFVSRLLLFWDRIGEAALEGL